MRAGPLLASPGGRAARGVVVSTDTLPFEVWARARYAPSVALALMMKRNPRRLTVTYESVAGAIVGNLAADGGFQCKRAGIGWDGRHA